MRKKYLLIAFACMVLAQLAFPLKMILGREVSLLQGETFLMKVKPLDPYDAFRGRYVTISYEDDEVPLPQEYDTIEEGKELYVRVKKDSQGRLIYDQVSSYPPTDTDNYLKGKTVSYGSTYAESWIKIDFPNRYYMNENKAPLAETLLNEAYAEVVIYKGEVVLKGIQVKGMPIEKYIDLSEKDY